jgi:hypothetical protein
MQQQDFGPKEVVVMLPCGFAAGNLSLSTGTEYGLALGTPRRPQAGPQQATLKHETDRKILKSAQQGYCIKIPYL